MHFKGIVYRDLKLENILLTSSGRIMLSDFDLSLMNQKVKTKVCKKIGTVTEPNVVMYEKNGTLEYLPPEMVLNIQYTCIIDWWAFGILTYEMFYGKTPFVSPSVEKTYKNIIQCNVNFPTNTPKNYLMSKKARNLIKELLRFEPIERLGYQGGALEIQSHPFFRDVNFDQL